MGEVTGAMLRKQVLGRLSADKSIAEWKAAEAVLDELGREEAVLMIGAWVGVGLNDAEADTLIYMVRHLANEQEALAL